MSQPCAYLFLEDCSLFELVDEGEVENSEDQHEQPKTPNHGEAELLIAVKTETTCSTVPVGLCSLCRRIDEAEIAILWLPLRQPCGTAQHPADTILPAKSKIAGMSFSASSGLCSFRMRYRIWSASKLFVFCHNQIKRLQFT